MHRGGIYRDGSALLVKVGVGDQDQDGTPWKPSRDQRPEPDTHADHDRRARTRHFCVAGSACGGYDIDQSGDAHWPDQTLLVSQRRHERGLNIR